MSRAMALDLGPYGVRVNILVPGSIDTTGINEEGKKLRGANIPLGRIGDPTDLTGAAVFLACLLYTSQSPRDLSTSRMPSSA